MDYSVGYLKDVAGEDEVDVNATGNSIERFTWPSLTQNLYYLICFIVSNIMLIAITVAISQQCLVLKLERTAEHAFYCTVSQVLCMGEALLIHQLSFHTLLGLIAFALGTMGVAVQIWRKKKLIKSRSTRHFGSKHGIFGLIGCLLLLACLGTGMSLLLYHFHKNLSLKLLLGHRICGLTGFLAFMCSQIFSYDTGFVHRNWEQRHIALFKYGTLVATIAASSYEFSYLIFDIVNWIPKGVFDAIKVYEHI